MIWLSFPPQVDPYIGTGVISGTVKIKGLDQAGATVTLFSQDTDLAIASDTSDISGSFTFTGLSKSKQFWIRIVPPDPTWEHLIRSRITPV